MIAPPMGLPRRAHLIGVGGAGQSALARLLRGAGVAVTGSDAVASRVLSELVAEGLEVWGGSHPERLAGNAGWVVRSAAVADGDPEHRRAVELGWTGLVYAEALGRLSAMRRTLAVAGAHGKTTTTAMLVAALRGGGIDPSHVVGGDVPAFGGSGRAGASDWLAVEACEFNRSFLHLRPLGAAIVNVDHDHFDCYPTLDDLYRAYADFASRVRHGGWLVAGADVPAAVLAGAASGVRILRVGDGAEAEGRAGDAREHDGCWAFTPTIEGRELPRLQLAVPGRFQIGNALLALASALAAGADPVGACRGVAGFTGVRRRFETHRGPRGGVVVEDYAHHPAEIAAVVAAARQRFAGRRLLIAFQPHQHQRTRALLADFARALAAADASLVFDIYGARESAAHRASVSAHDLVAAVCAAGGRCEAGGGLAEVASRVAAMRRPDDVVLVLGAGDIDSVVADVVART